MKETVTLDTLSTLVLQAVELGGCPTTQVVQARVAEQYPTQGPSGDEDEKTLREIARFCPRMVQWAVKARVKKILKNLERAGRITQVPAQGSYLPSKDWHREVWRVV